MSVVELERVKGKHRFQNRASNPAVRKCRSLLKTLDIRSLRMSVNEIWPTMPALPATPFSYASHAASQSSFAGMIRRFPSSICLRNRLTAERDGLRAAALPHSSKTKLLVTKSARQAGNSEKHACAARCHWSLSSQTANRPTVSKKTVMAGAHYGAQPHLVRPIGNVHSVWRKRHPDGRSDLPVAEQGAAQIPLASAPAVRPFPVGGIRRFHRLHGSSSCSPFTMFLEVMPVRSPCHLPAAQWETVKNYCLCLRSA